MPQLGNTQLEFANLKQGMSARITGITCNCSNSVRLQEMGLTVGTVFNVIKVAPFGDPVEIDVRGYRLCLRKNETTCFEIEPVV
jgi:ferrous iron transport protein A